MKTNKLTIELVKKILSESPRKIEYKPYKGLGYKNCTFFGSTNKSMP